MRLFRPVIVIGKRIRVSRGLLFKKSDHSRKRSLFGSAWSGFFRGLFGRK